MTSKKSKKSKIKHLTDADYDQYIMSLKDEKPLSIYEDNQDN